jgi:hypothetical protein
VLDSETESEYEDLARSEPLSQRLHRALVPLSLIAVTVFAGFHLLRIIDYCAVNLLFSDQWDFMRLFFGKNPSWMQLFLLQHGPIREGLGLIVDKYLYAWTDWNARAEAFLIAGFVFAAMLLALLLKRKLFGRLSYADIAIPLMFLPTTQFESFTVTPNAAYSGIPLVLIMLYCLALTETRYRVRYPLVLLLNFLATFTGFGFFMGPITIGLFALECRRRAQGASEAPLKASLCALLIALATLALFFVHYRWNPAVDCYVFPYRDLTAYPVFVATMIGRYLTPPGPRLLGQLLGAAGIASGVVVAIALAVRLAKRRRWEPKELVVAVLLTYTVLFCANTAVGRVCLGTDGAWSSRYAMLAIPGVLAVYLQVQTLGIRYVRNVLAAALILALIPGCLLTPQDALWFARVKQTWASCYVATENIEHCDQAAGFYVYPDPEGTHLKEKLDYLKERHLNLFADF